MKHIQKAFLLFLFISVFSISMAEVHYVKTGYFTHVYAREHVTDMPRGYYMLIEADGTMTPIWFHRYSTKNTGEFGKWSFDPREYLGKTISIDCEGVLVNNNNEYPIYEDGKLVLLPNFELEILNSLSIVSDEITVGDNYKYPNSDTLLISHDVLVAEETYADKAPTKVVQLSDYVQGEGTEASPFISTDGYAGLKDAITALPDGGTIEAEPGVYKATSKQLSIPRFVSIKGVGASKPYFILSDERMWYLKGSNTIDNIDVDMTQIDRSYTHEVISIHNNARDVTIKHSKFIGNYTVDPVTYKESGNVVMFRMYSHLNNITFESDTLLAPLRGIVTKGQRNQHNITFKDCLFADQGQMCVSLDQSSNISNVLFENNKFMEFSHFGVALARINDVTFRNNTFYSRNIMSFNTYNQALHIEEHTQNLLIENNHIDVIFRHNENDNPNTLIRSEAMLMIDSRNVEIRNNTVVNSDIIFNGSLSNIAGHSIVHHNSIDNGGIEIRDVNNYLTVSNNDIANPPVQAIDFYSTVPRFIPFQGHVIKDNVVTGLEDKTAFTMRGDMQHIDIVDNSFTGCDQSEISLDLNATSNDLKIKDNSFNGLASRSPFVSVGDLPNGISLDLFNSWNSFTSDCSTASIDEAYRADRFCLYPNPVRDILTIKGDSENQEYFIFDLNGRTISKGLMKGNTIDVNSLVGGFYFLQIEGEMVKFAKI